MYQLNDQQRMIQDMLRDYMTKEIQPKVEAWKRARFQAWSFRVSLRRYRTFGDYQAVFGKTCQET